MKTEYQELRSVGGKYGKVPMINPAKSDKFDFI